MLLKNTRKLFFFRFWWFLFILQGVLNKRTSCNGVVHLFFISKYKSALIISEPAFFHFFVQCIFTQVKIIESSVWRHPRQLRIAKPAASYLIIINHALPSGDVIAASITATLLICCGLWREITRIWIFIVIKYLIL